MGSKKPTTKTSTTKKETTPVEKPATPEIDVNLPYRVLLRTDISRAADPESTRYALHGFGVYPPGKEQTDRPWVAATDSKCLACAPVSGSVTAPMVCGAKVRAADLKKGTLITGDIKGSTLYVAKKNGFPSDPSTMDETSKANVDIKHFDPVDGRFPVVQDVFPAFDKAKLIVSLDTELLRKVAAGVNSIDGEKITSVSLIIEPADVELDYADVRKMEQFAKDFEKLDPTAKLAAAHTLASHVLAMAADMKRVISGGVTSALGVVGDTGIGLLMPMADETTKSDFKTYTDRLAELRRATANGRPNAEQKPTPPATPVVKTAVGNVPQQPEAPAPVPDEVGQTRDQLTGEDLAAPDPGDAPVGTPTAPESAPEPAPGPEPVAETVPEAEQSDVDPNKEAIDALDDLLALVSGTAVASL